MEMGILRLILAFLRVLLGPRASLAAENLALRQQLLVLHRSVKRPNLRRLDRIFWSWLSRLWKGWRSALFIVQPDTVTRWHRQGLGFTGGGSPARSSAGPRLTARSVTWSVACRARTRHGALRRFCPSCFCWATRWP